MQSSPEITKVYYNKLVRDNIPAKIETKHNTCEVRKIAEIQELQQELLKKIKEDASSLTMARTKEQLLEARKENLVRKGAYKQGHFLHWSDDIGYQSNESPQAIPL